MKCSINRTEFGLTFIIMQKTVYRGHMIVVLLYSIIEKGKEQNRMD